MSSDGELNIGRNVRRLAFPSGTEMAQRCEACVILPARNEADSIVATLDAIARQVDTAGHLLDPQCYEILLLLNNCTDNTAAVVGDWKAGHPGTVLHVLQLDLPVAEAHVGTARKLLMDAACKRFEDRGAARGIVCSTDADTLIAADWIANTLHAFSQGVDAVAGAIELKAGELEKLPAGARKYYLLDREYQRMVAQIEDRLDPQKADPWPRHLAHFGASLACTWEAYQQVGGMPAAEELEDLAFVDALRRADMSLRHEPTVRVYTSARLEGRASVGLSWQLSTWQEMSERNEIPQVSSAEWLCHRFRTLRSLRELCSIEASSRELGFAPRPWHERIVGALERRTTIGEFLAEIDCNRLIEETFQGARTESFESANSKLQQLL